MKKLLSALLCIALLVCLCACGKTEAPASSGSTEVASAGSESKELNSAESELKEFIFIAEDIDGNELYNGTITTDKEILSDTLLELELIEGEAGPYGLYVKTVCGVLADYETDGTFWCLMENGEMAMSGIEATKIEDGVTYSFIQSK